MNGTSRELAERDLATEVWEDVRDALTEVGERQADGGAEGFRPCLGEGSYCAQFNKC